MTLVTFYPIFFSPESEFADAHVVFLGGYAPKPPGVTGYVALEKWFVWEMNRQVWLPASVGHLYTEFSVEGLRAQGLMV